MQRLLDALKIETTSSPTSGWRCRPMQRLLDALKIETEPSHTVAYNDRSASYPPETSPELLHIDRVK